MFSFRQYTDVALLVLGLALCPAFAGCNGLGLGNGISTPSTQKNATPPESSRKDPALLTAADRAVFSRIQESVKEKNGQARERSVWVRSVDPASQYRWHYPKLDEILAQPIEQRPNMILLLSDQDPNVGFNAAIELGRTGDRRATENLLKAIHTATLPSEMRAAAVESLGATNDPAVTVQLRKLIDQYGQYSKKSSASYQSDLHLELIRGLARYEDAADDERFQTALKSPRPEVRLETLKAWTASKRGILPMDATDLRTDSDARVRAASLAAAVAQKHPQAIEFLKQGLTDADAGVRKGAIDGLGLLGGKEALAILKEQYKDRSDGIRCEVVKAFRTMNAESLVLEAVNDKSWRVRLKAADALSAFPCEAGSAAAEKLIADPSAEVQSAAVVALSTWPIERSGPILLAAMGKSSYAARKAAAAELAEAWPSALKFPVEGPADRRKMVLQALETEFHDRFRVTNANGGEAISIKHEKSRPLSLQAIAKVESLLDAGDVQGLLDFGPSTIDALETMRFDRERALPEKIYREVLPRLQPLFAAIEDLSSHDLSTRRRAAKELQGLAAKQSVGRLALDRLSQLMAMESDDLVWLGVLQAVENENGEEAAELVSVGLGHSSSEVRRRACTYLAAHPDKRHNHWLLPALNDHQSLVVCAALEALAAAGMNDPSPIKRLLGSNQEEIQLAAAIALVRLGDASGTPALERLAYSNDPQMRARVAVAMGENPDPAFLPILIHMLGDQAAVSHAALKSLPQVAGEDISQPAGQPPAAIVERIARWKRWSEQR